MPFLLCVVPVCPMRATGSHRSEQTSQLLFGDVAEVLETAGDFTLVNHPYDGYEGWVQRSQLAEINMAGHEPKPGVLAADFINKVTINGAAMQVPLGCSLSYIAGNSALIENLDIQYKGNIFNVHEQADVPAVMKQVALQYLNTSYQWGGRSVYGVDCSGFCQMVYRFAGVPLLRDAWQQASQGQAIGFLQEVQFGDLAFFDNEEGKITHVGLLLNQQSIIHASGKVRIDTIDHQGIINVDTGLRTHRLRVIKRIL